MPIDQQRLHRTLNPRSIAVVGDKAPDYRWLGAQSEFTGELYSVQVDPDDVAEIERRGYRNFSSLAEIDDEIDLVICAVPRAIAPRIVADAVQKGVGGMSMYTSGFAETGEPEAIALQQRIVELANADGMPVVGPNCLGIYNRRLGVKFSAEQQQGDGGTVSVAAQSGTHSGGLSLGLQNLGVKVSRAISIGNTAVISEADYLEYLMNDDWTEVIVMYIEGLKEGRRFFQLLREATLRKPVVLWRGGRTVAGARAIQSHTGSLASEMVVWEAMLHQAGAIGTGSIDETLDVTSALVHANASSKRGLALIAMTGGQSVALTDQFSLAGFDVPQLSDAAYAKLAEFFITVGGSYRNPFDASSTIRREDDNLEKILEILAGESAIDGGIAIELGARDFDTDPSQLDRMLDLLESYRERTGQPVIALMHEGGAGAGGVEQMVRARRHVLDRGFPVYPSFDRGAAALGRVANYYVSREARAAS